MMSLTDPGSTSGLRSSSASTTYAPRSSGRIPVSDPLKARPIGLRTASTMTASGMKSSPSEWSGGALMLGNQHQLSVRGVLLATPRLARPVKRKCLPFDLQIATGGQLDEPRIGRLGLLLGDVPKRESNDRERLAANVTRPNRGLSAGRLAELDIAGRVTRGTHSHLSRRTPKRINDNVKRTGKGV